MKTRSSIIIAIIATIVITGILAAIYTVNVMQIYQNEKQLEEFKEKRDAILNMLKEEKQTFSESSRTNFVIIYSTFDHNQNRIYTEPHDLTIYLEQDDVVTWINKADHTATAYDRDEGTWSTGEIKPIMQKSVRFNNTGFYQYAVDTEIDRHHGEIVAISNETNSLPIEVRSKMAQSMVSGDRYNNPALIGVGIGDPAGGIIIDINKEKLENIPDAKSFYYNMYRNLIPFDVPITIGFSEPFRALTG